MHKTIRILLILLAVSGSVSAAQHARHVILFLGDRTGTSTLSATSMAVTTFLMLYTDNPTVAWAAVFCTGLAMVPVFPTTLAIVADSFPRVPTTAMGIVITCGWIGLAVSSPIIGWIAKSSGLKQALLLLPVLSVAMIVVNLLLRPRLKRAAA